MSLVYFHSLIPTARNPQRATRDAGGTIPMRAAKYCDAITQASAFGYYLFSPMDFSLMWDGTEVFWTHAGVDEWEPLGSTFFPGFAEAFDAAAPSDLAGMAPPFLTALPEPGHIQVWTGLIASTEDDWSLLVRPVPNMPAAGGFVPYEGIVETDRWFGPLFTNIRMTRTHSPVHVSSGYPLVQAVLIPRELYSDKTIDSMEVMPGLSSLTEEEWAFYQRSIVEPNSRPDRPLGAYAVEARRQRKRCRI